MGRIQFGAGGNGWLDGTACVCGGVAEGKGR